MSVSSTTRSQYSHHTFIQALNPQAQVTWLGCQKLCVHFGQEICLEINQPGCSDCYHSSCGNQELTSDIKDILNSVWHGQNRHLRQKYKRHTVVDEVHVGLCILLLERITIGKELTGKKVHHHLSKILPNFWMRPSAAHPTIPLRKSLSVRLTA